MYKQKDNSTKNLFTECGPFLEKLSAVYFGRIISPLEDGGILDISPGALVIDEDGVIRAVTAKENWLDLKKSEYGVVLPERLKEIDLGRKLILPGFIDMHVHLPQITEIGRNGEHLLGWLEKYIFPAEARFSDIEHASALAEHFFQRLAANGTTMAVVFSTVHEKATDLAFEAAARRGSRAIIGKVMMDANSPSSLMETTRDSIAASERLAAKWHGYDNNRLLYAYTPRFAVSCSKKLMDDVGRLWHKCPGTYIHTHLAESLSEVELVERMFPGYRSYLDVYHSSALTGERSVFAHAIHLDDKDIETLRSSGSSLAHCPSSNFFLKSGVFKYSDIEDAGVRFGLGSDVAAGPELSLLRVMKDANYIQPSRWLSPLELFERATLKAARALSLDREIGSLEQGKQADFIIVDPELHPGAGRSISQSADCQEILSFLVFTGDDRIVEKTLVRGKEIYSSKASI